MMNLVRRNAANAVNAAAAGQNAAAPLLSGFDEIRHSIESIQNNDRLKLALLSLLDIARTDTTQSVAALTKFNNELAAWYDHAMLRVSGWYKRRTQWFLLGIAGVFACALNVDTVKICQSLNKDGTLRGSMVEAAKQYAAKAAQVQPAPDSSNAAKAAADSDLSSSLSRVQESVESVSDLGIPLGWNTGEWDKLRQDNSYLSPLTKVFGLLMTAFAASLGAPFWFDVLNMFMSVRGSGNAPTKQSTDLSKPHAALSPNTATERIVECLNE